MASCTQTSKAVSDVQECVDGLIKCFTSVKLPINDDNETFHRLQEKLEFILLLGLKEKPSIFGGKKSFWEYIFSCYNSSKRSHSGIKFVKSCSELKTSIGRGRAFIRFCLKHQSLADSLQTCFIDQKNTRDHYVERSLPCQQKLWSPFITSLYNLNEIKFDLNSQYSELDTSWPTFARKVFCPSENSLNSQSPALETYHLVEANTMLEANVLYLQKKCESLEKEIQNNEKKAISSSYEKVLEDSLLKNSVEINGTEDLSEENNYYHCSDSFKKYHEFVKNINAELFLKCEGGTKDICDNSNCLDKSLKSLVQEPSLDSLSDGTPLENCCDTAKVLNICNISSETHFPSPVLPTIDATASGLNVEFGDADSRNSFCDRILPENFVPPINSEISGSLGSLFLNTKLVISKLENSFLNQDVSSLASNLNSLKYSWHAFESCLLSELENFKELYLQKKFFADYAIHIKYLSEKQESMIDTLAKNMNSSVEKNESLYNSISLLKDKLHSFGLLRIKNSSDSSKSELPSTDCSTKYLEEDIDFKSCEYVNDDCLEPIEIMKSSFSKLNALNTQVTALQSSIESSHKLNGDLISRVQDHEMHMKGITKELQEAHHLLSVMRKQHQKLQSAENIVKYDLQEKRKLLNRLKEQLETTREDSNLMWQKNSQSEVEWKSLRKEFVERHKQNSEESGFVDEKLLGDQSSSPSSSTEENIYVDEVVDGGLENCEMQLTKVKKSRLDLLEEQCQILCTNLLNSSKRREEIDSHLESLCEMIENPSAQINTTDENVTECHEDIYLEVPCLNSDEKSEVSSSASPEIDNSDLDLSTYDSLNSIEVSKDIDLVDSKIVVTAEDSCCKNGSSVEGSFVPISPSEELSYEVRPVSSHSCPEFSEAIDFFSITSDSTEQNVLVMKDIPEESGSNDVESNYESILLNHDVSLKTIAELEEENKILQSRLRDLEKENSSFSSKINQCNTMEAAKVHEISALQFQLNSQALQYEKAIKEYSDNSDELRDMKEKISEQEQLILSLEEALTEIQIERENEKEFQWEQLEDFKRYSLKDREGMESEISFLQNYSKELQKKVIKLLKQKDVLWKQNDHFTFVQKIQIDDRWMADNEVSECLGCGSNFSFILRKHHCRHCGRIFCYSCSNNWLLTPSSRKQIRVCNDCYMQHMEIKEVVRRNSNPTYYDDESEEEATNLSPRKENESPLIVNASFSESQQTRAHSIVSLPVLEGNQLQKKSHYASAPDLHLILNYDSDPREFSSSIQPAILCDNEAFENGVHGDLIIKSGEEALLPITCETDSSQLHWSVYPQEAIPMKLVHESMCNHGQTVLHQSSCEVQSVICLSLPGLYNFHFDNRSRSTTIIIHYNLKILSTEKDAVYR